MNTIHSRLTGLMVGAIAAPIASLTFASSAQAVVLGYWNFNNLNSTTDGTTTYAATSGVDTNATLTLGGITSGITNFGGTTLNALNSDPAGQALAIQGGAGTPIPNNGSTLTFLINMTGYNNPILSFATRNTSSGFTNNQASYSTNGIDFTAFGSPLTGFSTTFATRTIDFSSVNALDNAASAYLRITLSGATDANGNQRFDNIQVNAEPVPEPITILGGLTALGMGGAIKRKLRGQEKVEA